MKLNGTHRLRVALALWFLLVPSVGFVNGLSAAQADLKPGDTIGPENWQKVKGMVGENLLNRIKQGYSFSIKQGRSIGFPTEYNAATARYFTGIKLGPNGELLNYVAGLPFPDVRSNDPQVGLKMAWNFYWRWIGDDYRTGGGTHPKAKSFATPSNVMDRNAAPMFSIIP